MKNRPAAILCMASLLASASLNAHSEPSVKGNRGEMLYDTHCIACHTTEVHWREKRLVTDWTSLMAQVRRWQGNSGLNWNEEDVTAVSEYLNRLYYNVPSGKTNEIAKMPNKRP